MNNNHQTVVVYESEGQRQFDQWYWNGGGAATVGWIAAAFVLVVLIGFIFTTKKKP